MFSRVCTPSRYAWSIVSPDIHNLNIKCFFFRNCNPTASMLKKCCYFKSLQLDSIHVILISSVQPIDCTDWRHAQQLAGKPIATWPFSFYL